jgi:catechol 2,3-dioxygenase-like lactoylglutathione lyase family enzyme
MAKARRFFADWGLSKVSGGKDRSLLRTLDHSEVMLRPRGHKSLPPGIGKGATVREITWGVKSKRDVTAIANELSRDRDVVEDADGAIHSTDNMGLGIAFRRTRRRPHKNPRALINSPSTVERVDQPATVYPCAIPESIGHTVWRVSDPREVEEFYAGRLGFFVTDRYVDGFGSFMRCKAESGHHDFVAFKGGGAVPRLDHVAFHVRDIGEVMAGGLNLTRKGWKTAFGPGRHGISSAYFWYFDNPCGGMAEYFTDEDHVTADWKPGITKRTRETFAEWFLPDGLPTKDNPIPTG